MTLQVENCLRLLEKPADSKSDTSARFYGSASVATFFAKSTKNDDFLHFLTSECTLVNRTIKMKVFVISFGVRGVSFTTVGVPIVEIFTWEASEMDKLCVKQRRNSI